VSYVPWALVSFGLMDILIALHRRLQRVVDVLHVRPLARRCFRLLLNWPRGERRLRRATQNDRVWRLDPEVALRGEFQEFETVRWLRQVLKPGMHAIDVGANVGQMTLEMAELVGPHGKVIAIEPAPGNVALLKRHIEANGFADRVRVIPAVCTEVADEKVKLKIIGNSPRTVGSGHTIMLERPFLESEKKLGALVLEIPTISIDVLCERFEIKPAAVKIDVEGAELHVLRGSIDTLRRFNPAIRFGFHPFAFADPRIATWDIRSLFRDLDYELEEHGESEVLQLLEYTAHAKRQ